MPPDPLTASSPRYLQVARSLMAEVASGHYPVGSKLPNEVMLSEQFGASRFTIRAAIERLASEGIVSRKPKVGTVVTATSPRAEQELRVGSLEDIQQYGSRTVMEVLDKRLTTLVPGLPSPLDNHVGEVWLYVEGLRTAPTSGETVCFNQVWVSPDYRGVSGIERVVTQSIWALVESQFGVRMANVQQEMWASALDSRAAKAMKLRKGSAALYVRRAFHDEKGRLIEVAVSVHPPDTFTYRLNVESRRAQLGKSI